MMSIRIILALVALCLWSCTPSKVYHSKENSAYESEVRSQLKKYELKLVDERVPSVYEKMGFSKKPFKMAFVEFDEEGQIYAEEQVSAALNLTKKTSGPVLIYCHGWNNNAKSDDVKDFRGILETFAKEFPTKPPLGIYIGWRGKSQKYMVPHLFTIWDRRQKARRIGKSKALQDFFVNVKGDARKSSNVYVIGHSLGAAMVEKAAAGIVSKYPRSKMPDCFFTINSAEVGRAYLAEKLFFKPQDSFSSYGKMLRSKNHERELHAGNMNVPYLINIQGEADGLVKWGIPATALIQYAWPNRSIGFASGLHTHRLARIGQNKAKSVRSLREIPHQPFHPSIYLNVNKKEPTYREFNLAEINDRIGPVWNVSVPREVVSGHNDAYNEHLVYAAASLYRYAVPQKELRGKTSELLAKLKNLCLNGSLVEGSEDARLKANLLHLISVRLYSHYEKVGIILEELETYGVGDEFSPRDLHYVQHLYAILRYLHADSSLNKTWNGNSVPYYLVEYDGENELSHRKNPWTQGRARRMSKLLKTQARHASALESCYTVDPTTSRRDRDIPLFKDFIEYY